MSGALLLGAASQKIALGQAYEVVCVNGTEIGAVSAAEDVDALILAARRQVMQETDGYAYVDAEVTAEERRRRFCRIKTGVELQNEIASAIKATAPEGKVQVYTITSGSYSADFASQEEAYDFLERVKNHTEGGEDFSIVLEASAGAKEAKKPEILSDREAEKREEDSISCGVVSALAELHQRAKEEKEYQNQTGILFMDFADNVYGYENLADSEELADPVRQTEEVTKEKETNTIYVVEAGDCLSVIAEKFDTTVESIVGLNELGSDEATVYQDQELIVAVPRPDISLLVTEGVVYEESYSEAPEIIRNDSWYTTQEAVRREGNDGQREVNVAVTYENGLEVERKTLHTTVLAEAVPAVIEQGTKIPPTYMKPISGGRYTSGFGRRWGRMHKGVDWAVSVGTPVFASSGGTVSVAGAARGYGYVVYINHPDGRQTRYGHLRKVLVTPGQTVEQGQKIALSGNTGRSTGPHLHFEILIDGSQVNPLNYMN